MQLSASNVLLAGSPTSRARRPAQSACTSLPHSHTRLRNHRSRPFWGDEASKSRTTAVAGRWRPLPARLPQAHSASSSSSSSSKPLMTQYRYCCSPSPHSLSAVGAFLPSAAAGEAYNIKDKPAAPPTGRAVIVGGGPSGLAAAIGLARQAGFAVDVFDSRPDPSRSKGAAGSSLLVALGARGLQALEVLAITLTAPPATAQHDSSSSGSGSGSASGKAVYVLGSDDPDDHLIQSSTGSTSSSSSSGTGLKCPAGLMMLQGMAVLGPDGKRRVERFNGAAAAAAGGTHVPGGIAVIDSHTLITKLQAEAAQVTAAAAARSSAGIAPTLGLTTDSVAAQEMASAAAAPGATGRQSDRFPLKPASAVGDDIGGVVRCHYESELVMLDTINKQATFMGPGGEAVVVPYDLLVAAEQPGLAGTTLIAAALAELQQRQHAHKHPQGHQHEHHAIYSSPAAAAASGADTTTLAAAAVASGSIAAAAAGSQREAAAARSGAVSAAAAGGDMFVELEYKGWRDMPHQRELEALLPAGAMTARPPPPPGQRSGWLLVWSTTTATLPRTAGTLPAGDEAGSAAALPGGPSCTLMAWPGRSGGSWSGAVFTAPQVFESLRSQADYEGLLRGLRCVNAATGSNTGGLPGLWVKGIAAQLKAAGQRVGRVPAPAAPPPSHLSFPSAGVTLLAPAATLTSSPQLLCPGVAHGLQDAAALAAAVADAVGSAAGGGGAVVAGSTNGSSAAQVAWSVERGLGVFDKERRRQVTALQQLEAQLSWLRHPFSPAAAAAAASIPAGSLAWLSGLLMKNPRAGLALQWRCMLAVLPLIAAMSKVLGVAVQRKHMDGGSDVGTVGDNLAAAGVAAIGVGEVLNAIQPRGSSFMAFVNTTVMSFPGVWQLLHTAPLIAGLLWTGVVFVAVKVVQWVLLAYRVWGVSQAAV